MAVSGTAVATGRAARGASTPRFDAEDIARVAYALYEQRGRANGYDLEDWLRAEEIVRKRRGSA